MISVPYVNQVHVFYRARLLEKMKLRNNAEVTRYAIRNQLVE